MQEIVGSYSEQISILVSAWGTPEEYRISTDIFLAHLGSNATGVLE